MSRPGQPGRGVGQQRHCAPQGPTLTPSPGVPLGPCCHPSPACPLPPGYPAWRAEGCRATDGLVSLAGAGGSTDSDYGGGGYHRDHGVSSGMAGWDGWCVVAETGTIAGIASALAMALIGAVSSYISYQQKKFCFSIQQGLNAEYVKGENMEAVVSEEPQVKYSVLETQSAEPPKQDSAKI
uniref:CD99 antigen-like protein 2 n=1 Tax=Strix occidentalis caurina TaxID=311401 RepID=A0A8D0F9A5_STROC